MVNIKKVFIIKLISLFILGVFLLPNSSYSLPIKPNYNLRVPMGLRKTSQRQKVTQMQTRTIRAFLQKTREDITGLDIDGDAKPKLYVVIGNEASDLDSMISSIAYAYAKAQELQDEGESVIVVPLMNIPEEDFRLRTEAVYLLERAGISENDLLFTDIMDLSALRDKGFSIDITLVDHNNLAQTQQDLWPLVTEIIDHHEDEKRYNDDVSVEIAAVGSAATLVAERILNKGILETAPELANLLLGPIILDTINLDEKGGRVTEKDRNVADILLKMAKVSQDEIYEGLKKAKADIGSLNIADLLRKDYKGYVTGFLSYGIASAFGLNLQELVAKKGDVLESLESTRTRYDVDVLFCMTAYLEGEVFKREILIYAPDRDQGITISHFLQDDRNRSLPLELQEISSNIPSFSSIPQVRAFTLAPKVSRKKLQPMLEIFLSSSLEEIRVDLALQDPNLIESAEKNRTQL